MLQRRHCDVIGHEIPKFNSKPTAIIYNKYLVLSNELIKVELPP